MKKIFKKNQIIITVLALMIAVAGYINYADGVKKKNAAANKTKEVVGTDVDKDLKDVDDSDLGLAGSPTKIAKASDKVRKGAGEKVALETDEAVDYIMGKLLEKHVI